MPRGDGTGPRGQRPGTGRGTGSFRGTRSGRSDAGPGGFCVCPNCGLKVLHRIGTPCFEQNCPNCGAAMTRK